MVRWMAACAVVCLAVIGVSADDKAFDAKKLEGKWSFVSGMKAGNEAGEDMKKTEFEVAKDSMTMTTPQGAFKFKYTIDSKASPVAIDLEITEGPIGVGSKSKGIVSLDGDEFKLCYTPMGDDRPKKFDGKESHLFVLKRKK
ncbi:MAG: TIGR03067 domain-containing protein [Gemmatales bacterium]